jgi:hypothetical protein
MKLETLKSEHFVELDRDLPLVSLPLVLIDEDGKMSEVISKNSHPWIHLAGGLLGATNENQLSIASTEDGVRIQLYNACEEIVPHLTLTGHQAKCSLLRLGTYKFVPVVEMHDRGFAAIVALTEDLDQLPGE